MKNSLIKEIKFFTFVKERNDDFTVGRNPRFDISTLQTDSKSLKINYINVDGEMPGPTVSDKKNQLMQKWKKIIKK